MSSHTLRARDYLEHMEIALERIRSYVAGKSEAEFASDTLLQDAVIRNLENLGEAAKNFRLVVPDAELRFPSLPFDILYATRNQLAHGYFKVDLQIVWRVAQRNLPDLERQLKAVLASWDAEQV